MGVVPSTTFAIKRAASAFIKAAVIETDMYSIYMNEELQKIKKATAMVSISPVRPLLAAWDSKFLRPRALSLRSLTQERMRDLMNGASI